MRPKTAVPRVPVDWDNTYDRDLRGDKAVPTLFNGNFDASFNLRGLIRKTVSKAVPGWSFHNDSAPLQSDKLVDLSKQNNTSPDLREHLRQVGKDPESVQNYALKLSGGDEATHNRFVVPDWGTLRFDLHVPNPTGGNLNVSIKGVESDDDWQSLGEIDLKLAEDPADSESAVGYYDYVNGQYTDPNTYSIDYGVKGFETFHLDLPDELREKPATLRFELTQGSPEIYVDDVFFQSSHLKLGNPTFARPSEATHRENYLIEKPQYSLS